MIPTGRSNLSRFVVLAAVRGGAGGGGGGIFSTRITATAFSTLTSNLYLYTAMTKRNMDRSPVVTTRDLSITAADEKTSSHPASPTPKFAWSITASLNDNNDDKDDNEIAIQKYSYLLGDKGHLDDKAPFASFDISQSSEWMEYLERKEHRQDDMGGAGAYDTLRCDLILKEPSYKSTMPSANATFSTTSTTIDCNHHRMRIWGEDYHLLRLQESYKSLLKVSNTTIDQRQIDKATQTSKAILTRLLSEAEASKALNVTVDNEADSNNSDTMVQLLRVTLLWSPPLPAEDRGGSGELSPSRTHPIMVRGHACSSSTPIKINANPDPIVASVAVHLADRSHSGHNNHHPHHRYHANANAAIDESLPTRYDNPQSKIASWCRLRKTMENPTTYKPPGTSEVLMVRERIDMDGAPRLEVLEGLSSNFFVIDKDGSLRTATQGVLHGYVRHLVMDVAAKKCGIPFDPRPIYLDQAAHEWKEAFITSSSRLIYPISKILVPEDHDCDNIHSSQPGTTFVEYWSDPCLESDPQWRSLLHDIVQVGGYPCDDLDSN